MANAYLSIGIQTFSLMLYDDRKFVETVMDIFNDWTLAVVEHINEMDFDYVIISDDLAHSAGPLFSPQIFRELFVPRYRRVVEKLKKPWILHTDGNFLPLIEDLLPLGMSAIGNLEPAAVDIVQLKKDYGHRVALLGNIDLNYTLTRATEEEVEAQVKLRISQLAPGGRYLLASENSIPSYVQPENLLAMSRAVEKYGYY
jgi:uroporphyrinogen-III decarboxylase